MKRRVFITSSLSLVRAAVARAREAGRVNSVVVITTGHATDERPHLVRFAETLHSLGYVEGVTLRLQLHFLSGQMDALPQLIAQVVQARPDVIVTWSGAVTVAATQAVTIIPIVFLAANSPVEVGLVESLARPGRNMTGVAWSWLGSETAKAFQILREVNPGIAKVALIRGRDPSDRAARRTVDKAAEALGIRVIRYEAESHADLTEALARIERRGMQALLIQASGVTYGHRRLIIEFAARLPLTLNSSISGGRAGGGVPSPVEIQTQLPVVTIRSPDPPAVEATARLSGRAPSQSSC